jgi:pimeloyl-[acyl-carrier protein] methyl ester esterase
MLPKRWVFLRGLAREKRHWGDFPEYFEAQFPGSQIEAIDLPGLGDFRHIESPTTVGAITDFVRDEAGKKFGDEKFGIFAVSLGAMVAMDWMERYPEKVEAAVLINPSSKQSAFFRRLRYQIYPQFIKLLTTTALRDREKKLIDLLMNSEEAKAKALPLWSKIAVEEPPKISTFTKQLFAASRFSTSKLDLKKIPKTAVLLLNSFGDRFVDPSCSETLHQKYQWKLERHPWAGHDLPWDDPKWVTDYIRRFFLD